MLRLLPSDDSRRVRRLAGLLAAHRFQLGAALANSAIAGLLVLLLGQGLRGFVDHGLHGTPADLDRTALWLMLVTLAYGATAIGRSYFANFIGNRVVTVIRQDAFRRLVQEEVPALERAGAGRQWPQVVLDAASVQAMISSLLSMLRSALIVSGGLAAMFLTSLQLSLTALVVAPVVLVLVLGFGRRVRRLSDKAQVINARSEALALECLDGVKTIKAFVGEDQAFQRYVRFSEEAFRFADRRDRRQALLGAVGVWLMFGTVVFLSWVAGHAVLQGMTEGAATTFLFYAFVVATFGSAISEAWGQFQKGLGALERLEGGSDAKPAPSAPPAARRRRSAGTPSDLRLENLHFRYSRRAEAEVLSGVDWRFEAGATTALVGRSGAGKSTLFQLFLRFYEPTQGRILLNGRDIAAMDTAELRQTIGFVAQEPVLFEGSILENIQFGRPSASPREVRAAAEAAYAMEFIETLPNGLATEVGVRGAQLSGGQRQRIAIARTILKDAPILLLDEATNSLDAQSEHLIHTAVAEFAKDRTTLIVAHRLWTVKAADVIVVLDRGRIVSSGRHADLLRERGLYADLAALQFQSPGLASGTTVR
jgi:ATP-binding cassette subfamily B protein